MSKAIKHVTAGLLHVMVLGQVPAEEVRRRGGRKKPTSAAQQFYNNKCSWRELELITAANFGGSDLVATFTYDDHHLPADKGAAGAEMKKFIRRLRLARKRRGEELKYIYNIEGDHGKSEDEVWGGDGALEDRRLHHHMILNRAGPGCEEELRSLWHGGGYVRVEPLDVHYYEELAKYFTKEAREGRPKPGERSWRGSKNLERYQVEYIEIPVDSVTLEPPPGAVDYRCWREKNPYGYADCVGARYLLYPERRPPGVSYAGRRTSQSALRAASSP